MQSFARTLIAELFSFYDAIFQPLLQMGPHYALGFFAAGLAGTFSLIYWRFLDIERKNELKEKLNKQQEKMKDARKEDDPDKVSEHMSKSLELNQKFMMLNFKPMIVTMLFVGLFFPWLGATFSPNIQLDDGTGELEYASNSVPIEVQGQDEPVLIIDGEEIEQGEKFEAHDITWEFNNASENDGFFSREGRSASVSAVFIPLPVNLWYIGSAINWLGFYILLAMPLTFAFRKKLGIV